MGHAGQDDEDIIQIAQAAIDRLTAIAQPRYRYVKLPLDAMKLPGEDICRHLAGCDSMYLLCATLGAAVDREIRFVERTSMLNALALDAAAGDGIEKVCDHAQEEIRTLEANSGRFITGRFSPGYGDLPMTVQPELIRLCDAPRRIGLSLTQSGILIPRKSVTAILGASSVPVEGRRRGCGTCRMTASCPFRKRGITCGS
ncbi:MAG: vitamin B12 dependent-methionine synthase activation domain-containing protein [Eubacteriales bacterium]|nr:vitamin B12 dependent-methionine synthase activation domain-containing protein [Eubacteriales bacterium]